MAQHDLGNWEVARGTYLPISQISQMTPAHLTHYYLGVTGTYFPISQIIPAQMAQHHKGNWELGNGYRYILPNFPISQKTPAQMGQHYLGKLGMSTGTYFPTSQFPKRSQPIWLSTIWETGKLGNEYRYILPNLPNNPSPDGPALFGKLGTLNPRLM